MDLLIRHLGELRFACQTTVDDLLFDPVDIQAAAIILDPDNDMAALVIGVQSYRPGFRLAGGKAVFGIFKAMVGGVADHMHQGVFDKVKHLAVELGVAANHLQVDLLFRFHRQIADDTGQLGPGVLDRLHARLHHPFLKIGGDVTEALERKLELAVFATTDHLQKLVAGQH